MKRKVEKGIVRLTGFRSTIIIGEFVSEVDGV